MRLRNGLSCLYNARMAAKQSDTETNKISISLPASLNAFVQREVASGCYSSASQYLEHLVREARKNARRSVDRLLAEGIASGKSSVMTQSDWDDIRREVKERSARRNGR